MKGAQMLSEAMKRQFSKAFDVLEAAIPSFSPDQWRRGSPPFNGPGRAVVHALQCAEIYTSEDSAVLLNFGKKVWEMSDADVPSQEKLLEYLQVARAKTLAWMDSLSDQGLAGAWHDAAWSNGLERVVYTLRHLQHHTGEVCAYQKQCGLPPAPWK
jgi:uncharacterized damage-inducible protein DinB